MKHNRTQHKHARTNDERTSGTAAKLLLGYVVQCLESEDLVKGSRKFRQTGVAIVLGLILYTCSRDMNMIGQRAQQRDRKLVAKFKRWKVPGEP